MRIGIDASRAFVDEPTGTETYSWEVISRLVQLPEAKDHEWVLCVRNLAINNDHLAFNLPIANFFKLIDQMPNVKLVNISWPRLWTQVGLAMRTWVDNLDVLWVPAHTLPVLRRPGVRTVVTIHGIEYEWLPAYENKLQRWYLPLSTQYAVKTANKIIAVSKFTANQLVDRLGASSEKIEVVYEGHTSPSIPLLTKEREVKGEVLSKFGLQAKKYILFIGTVQPRKNLERLVEAFARFNTQDSSLKLVIAGKMGWGNEAMLRNLQDSSLKSQVVLTGYINDAEKYTLLHYAMFYVQPSITEGFGLPVLEAWNAGLAVVSSSGGALREILQISNTSNTTNEYAGLLFDPYDVDDICDKIGQIINNSKLRRELEKKGKERLKDFSWDKAAKETFEILVSHNYPK